MFRFFVDPHREDVLENHGLSAGDINDLHNNAEISETNTMQCSICFDTIEIGMRYNTLDCNHSFHTHCITRWFTTHNTCPLCREPYGDRMRENENENENDNEQEVVFPSRYIQISYIILTIHYPDGNTVRCTWSMNDTLVDVFSYVCRSFMPQVPIILQIHEKFYKNTESLMALNKPLGVYGINSHCDVRVIVG